jgi:predicted DNA-binding transcriptional regulator AlpA
MVGKLVASSIQREKRSRADDNSPRLIAAPKLLTPADVAEITGLSVETLAQWRSQGRGIPYIKISRNCVRYQLVDLDAWLAKRIVRFEVEPSKP